MKRLNSKTVPGLMRRLESLTPEHEPQWGQMPVAAMIGHLAQGIRATFDPRPGQLDRSTLLSRTFMKHIAVPYLPWPKGKVESPPGLAPPVGSAVPEFDAAKSEFYDAMERFLLHVQEHPDATSRHLLFGLMTPPQTARFNWKHCDHHLRQFGV